MYKWYFNAIHDRFELYLLFLNISRRGIQDMGGGHSVPHRNFPALASLVVGNFIIKTNTKWFSVQDIIIQTLGMLLDFRKAKTYSPTRVKTHNLLQVVNWHKQCCAANCEQCCSANCEQCCAANCEQCRTANCEQCCAANWTMLFSHDNRVVNYSIVQPTML